MAILEWKDGAAVAREISVGWKVPELADLIETVAWTAIDAPFGWPDDFISVVIDWAETGAWTSTPPELLRYRLTDRIVSATRYPLSVSSDRIASTAMRCAELLAEMSRRSGRPLDRAGANNIIEVYPAAALKIWQPEYLVGYKGTEGRHKAKRAELLERLSPPDGWLALSEEQRALCVERDDATDALVSSLVARAMALPGLTEPLPVTRAETERIRREGWIHLPKPDTFDLLAG